MNNLKISTKLQGNPTRYQQLSYRILLAGWVLAACVLVNAYSSCLFSFLVSPTLQPVTKTLDELASGYPQRLKLLTEKSMYLADDIFLVKSDFELFLNIFSCILTF